MKKLLITAISAIALAGAVSATTIERTSIKLDGEATWIPTVYVDGVKIVPDEAGGTDGLSKKCAASQRCATEWAEARYGDVDVILQVGGFTYKDLNGNGRQDPNEPDEIDGGAGW